MASGQREIDGGLIDARAADHAHEHVLVEHLHVRLALEHREQDGEPIAVEPGGHAPRRSRRPPAPPAPAPRPAAAAAPARVGHDQRARGVLRTLGQKQPARVAAPRAAPRAPSRTRRARAPDRSGSWWSARCGSSSVESPSNASTVSTRCSSTLGPAMAPSLVTCPIRNTRDAARLGEVDQARGDLAQLAHAAGARLELARSAWSGSSRPPSRRADSLAIASSISLELGGGQHVARSSTPCALEALCAQRHLRARLLAGHVEGALAAARPCPPAPAAAAWTCRCPDRRRPAPRRPPTRPPPSTRSSSPMPGAACGGRRRAAPRRAARARLGWRRPRAVAWRSGAWRCCRTLALLGQGAPGVAARAAPEPARRALPALGAHVDGLQLGHRALSIGPRPPAVARNRAAVEARAPRRARVAQNAMPATPRKIIAFFAAGCAGDGRDVVEALEREQHARTAPGRRSRPWGRDRPRCGSRARGRARGRGCRSLPQVCCAAVARL